MARMLIVCDDAAAREPLHSFFKCSGHAVQTAATAADALDRCDHTPIDLVITELIMPDLNGIELLKRLPSAIPTIILTRYPEYRSAVEAMRAGARDYLAWPCEDDELLTAVTRAVSRPPSSDQAQPVRPADVPIDVIASTQTAPLWQMIVRVAKSPLKAILIQGETGTGKELVAKALHDGSPRQPHPFIPLNAAALSEHLFESELFGHERGAFTDAKAAKPGLCELADRGTLFLDEIGDMPLSLQAKLLRFLETGTFRRVGATRETQVNVRIVAATNRPLEQDVAGSRFRADLYYRLRSVPLTVPPLRERPAEILPLMQHFLSQAAVAAGVPAPQLSRQAIDALQRYPWPGNVRELKHLAEAMLIVLPQGQAEVCLEHLPDALRTTQTIMSTPESCQSLASAERVHIDRVLARVHGNKTQAARLLGISRQTLRTKLRDGNGAALQLAS